MKIAVVDASLVVDLINGSRSAPAIAERLRGCMLHAPAHLNAETLSALGRLHRAGALTADDVGVRLEQVIRLPVQHHPVTDLLIGAWRLRENYRLADALYVHLAASLGAPLLTVDGPLARSCTFAENLRGRT